MYTKKVQLYSFKADSVLPSNAWNQFDEVDENF